jgi:LacI family transcriptional regulator
METQVHVLVGRNPFHAAEALRGVASAVDGRRQWINVVESANDITSGKNRGVLLIRTEGRDVERLKRLGITTVGLFNPGFWPEFPSVLPDDVGIGAVGAEHLANRGFGRVAFCSVSAIWSRRREEGFVSTSTRLGLELASVFNVTGWPDGSSRSRLKSWLAALPIGVGLMCANDQLACLVRDLLLQLGRSVPEEVGLVGVDNDELRSGFGRVPITSVERNARAVGTLGVRLLLELLDGKSPPTEPLVVPPGQVFARRSTEMLAVNDEDVRSAVRFIADHVGEGITVEDVLRHVAISRSGLDRRMKAAIGRTCSDEIERARLHRAKQMLLETDLDLTEIAAACGYHYLSHFSHAFRRGVGVPPSKFRKQHRSASTRTTR